MIFREGKKHKFRVRTLLWTKILSNIFRTQQIFSRKIEKILRMLNLPFFAESEENQIFCYFCFKRSKTKKQPVFQRYKSNFHHFLWHCCTALWHYISAMMHYRLDALLPWCTSALMTVYRLCYHPGPLKLWHLVPNLTMTQNCSVSTGAAHKG